MKKTLTTLMIGASIVLAPTASAHDELTGTSPKNGASVTSAPATVGLTFAETPLNVGNQISVKAPDGSTSAAKPTVNGTTVSAPFTNHGNGLYTVTWRVVSDDGHPVSGAYSFTLTGASSASPTSNAAGGGATASATPTPTSTSTFVSSAPSAASKAHTNGDGGTAWGVLGGAAALAAIVMAAVALASRRRRAVR